VSQSSRDAITGHYRGKSWEDDMAKGEQRSNREKKKPKADKNNTKVAPAGSPFASTKFPGKPAQGQVGKKSP
jgi:hypothetical protein